MNSEKTDYFNIICDFHCFKQQLRYVHEPENDLLKVHNYILAFTYPGNSFTLLQNMPDGICTACFKKIHVELRSPASTSPERTFDHLALTSPHDTVQVTKAQSRKYFSQWLSALPKEVAQLCSC